MCDIIPVSDAKRDMGEMLLQLSREGKKAKVSSLLEAKVNPMFRGKAGQTALHEAASHNHYYIVEELLQLQPELRDVKDKSGQTAIHCAASRGNVDVLEALLGQKKSLVAGASMEVLTAKTSKYGWTALHYAANGGHTLCAAALVQGAPCELIVATTNTGRTALHIAAHAGHTAVMEVLLGTRFAQELIEAKSSDGHSALHLAARFGHSHSAHVLGKAAPELLKATNLSGHVPLHESARRGYEECVDTLVQLGAHDHLTDKTVKYARFRGHGEIADALGKTLTMKTVKVVKLSLNAH
mmetsp:Transcript_67653/g.122011  ORF Transcript_67653/g.122011 Transcript_67653/m.122011 type:complete len:297 (+) Transcript_67653:76-966(+)